MNLNNDKIDFSVNINNDSFENNSDEEIYKPIKNKNLWIEKYRPQEIKDLILSDLMRNKITNLISSNILPNIIFKGLPGTGKTSSILCIAKKIIGEEYNNNILELNASENRGLEYINSDVYHFCKKMSNIRKLIIFDEADNITKKAQNKLVNLMEEFASTTSFAFTCNDSSKIIEAIQSRCICLNYSKINEKQVYEKLIKICKIENIIYNEEGINQIIKISNGDIRQAINNLEITYHNCNNITKESVNILCYQPQQDSIKKIIINIINLQYFEAIDEIKKLKLDSYCASDILLSMINYLKDTKIFEKKDEDVRINFIKILSDGYIIISDGIDSNLQIYSCLGKMFNYIKN